MPKKLTHMQRAERWYNQQVKNKNLREADYSTLTKRMTLCYEPAVMMSHRNERSLHDILQQNKLLEETKKIKL